jgi:hypothetical protein
MKLTQLLFGALTAASLASAHPKQNVRPHAHENIPTVQASSGPAPLPLKKVTVNNVELLVNTSAPIVDGPKAKAAAQTKKRAVTATTVSSTFLVIARDDASARSAYSGLNDYGIPYQTLIVPQGGIALPTLYSSATNGNFGGIVLVSEVSYDYGGTLGYQSALTAAQFDTLYAYQLSYGVRMVRQDVYPSDATGTLAIGGCCADGVEQTIALTSTTGFATSGLKT